MIVVLFFYEAKLFFMSFLLKDDLPIFVIVKFFRTL